MISTRRVIEHLGEDAENIAEKIEDIHMHTSTGHSLSSREKPPVSVHDLDLTGDTDSQICCSGKER